MKARLLAAALPVAAAVATIAPAPVAVEALGGCTELNGSQWTSGTCTNTSDGKKFMHAEQTCVKNYYTWVIQDGPSVGVGGYSSAGPCTSPITGRHLVQTTFP